AERERLIRAAKGHFATGVTIVTARGPDGVAVGTTGSSFSPVSSDPPLLLVCLASESEVLARLKESGRFAINILADDQRHHSARFAVKGDFARVHDVTFEEHLNGVPTLPGSFAMIACDVQDIHAAGDHDVVIAEPMAIETNGDRAAPLLAYRGDYLDPGRSIT
ncbi:MAG: flavin reductase family protein, partial [Solirubrobacterales bacterium]